MKTVHRAAKNILLFVNLGYGDKIVCEMKLLFTTGYIQYTIGLQLYLSKRYIDKVTESGFQAIRVSGDVAKWVMVFRKILPKFENSSFDTFKRTLKRFWSTAEKLRNIWSIIEEIAKKNSCYIFFHKTLLKFFLPSLRIFWEIKFPGSDTFCSCGVGIFKKLVIPYKALFIVRTGETCPGGGRL